MFQNVVKAVGIVILGSISLFVPVIGPILFIISLVFAGRFLYFAWWASEREFAITNRVTTPNVIFDPKRNLPSYQDTSSDPKNHGEE